MYEHFNLPLASREKFIQRLFQSGGLALILMIMSLSLGILGFHFIAGFNLIDSYFNAAMILGGMGLVTPVTDDPGKIFTGCYAIFSGGAFLTSIAVFLSPVVHRFMHKYHIEDKNDN